MVSQYGRRCRRYAAGPARYCASVTCSIQSTGLPSSFSWMAMWLIAVVGGGAVPVLLAGREPDDVAGADLLDRPALALHPAAAGGDDQRLAERVGVPGRPRARLEGDQRAGNPGRVGRAEQRVDADRAGEPVRRALAGGLRACSLDVHCRVSCRRGAPGLPVLAVEVGRLRLPRRD